MQKRLFWSAWAGIVLFVLCLALCTVKALQYRFGGYDLSPLIDSGWRVLQGQVPNRDFICTFPPILYLGAALAFRILGVRWIALSLSSAFYSVGLTLLGMRILLLLRKCLGEALVLRLSVVFAILQMLPFLAIGHPWHSSWTEAADLYAFAATFALLEIKPRSAPNRDRIELLAHLCLAESLILLAKPNTALPALAFCTLALLVRKNTRATAVIAVCTALVLTSILLLGVHTSLFRQAQVYSQLSARFLPQGYFEGLAWHRDPYIGLSKLTSYIALLPALVWVLWVVARSLVRRTSTAFHILAVGGCVVTLIGLGTNTEFSPMDLPSLLFVAALLWSVTPTPAAWFQPVFAYILASLLVSAAFFDATRERMQTVGEWAEDRCGVVLDKRSDPFFGTFKACPPFFSVLDETDKVVAGAPGTAVFFGPRMEFLYARDHLPSPRGLPLWWHPGTSFPIGAEPAIDQAWQANHFGLVIFPHNDRTRVPPAILDAIGRDYVEQTLGPADPDALEDAKIDVYTPRKR